MPTGYTVNLMEKGESFKEFAMRAVRAMGVCCDMRDEPMDAKIPEKFEPSSYHIEALKEARAKFKKLHEMTKDEILKYGKKKQKELIKSCAESWEKDKLEQSRLDEMAKKVQAWKVGDEYQPFKDFMLDQLRISGGTNDYYKKAIKDYKKMTIIEFYQNDLDSAANDIRYHKNAQEDDIKNYEKKNQYLSGIHAALETIKD